MSRESVSHTLQPTALVNEVYMRLVDFPEVDWQSRAHFYAVAASTIRRILVDYARVANAQRRPRPSGRMQFEDVVIYSNDRAEEILVVDEALRKLQATADKLNGQFNQLREALAVDRSRVIDMPSPLSRRVN